MKKVLVITYYWPPSGGSGVQRILKFVKYLPSFGIKPYVVTVREDKASYPVFDNTLINDVPSEAEVYRTDTFEPYEIYSRLLGKKSIPMGFSNESNPSAFQSFSRFIRGNFFIPDARKGWIKYAFEESCRLIEEKQINIVLTTSPPHSVQQIGLKLKKKYNIKWIADLRDPWTDIYYYNEFHHHFLAKKLDMKYEKQVLECADKIITVSSPLKDLFVNKSNKIESSKVSIIPNGFDQKDFQEKEESSQDEFIITYTGTLADSYNPNVFFDSFNKVISRYSEVKFKLIFLGNLASSVVDYLRKVVSAKHLEILPFVTHEESIKYLLRSTVLFLVIPQIKHDKGILTGKLFEYLAAKKPIVCIGPEDGDAAFIINECQSGKTFNRTMELQLTQYLEELILKWKDVKNIDVTNNLFQKYSRYNQTKSLVRIIENI